MTEKKLKALHEKQGKEEDVSTHRRAGSTAMQFHPTSSIGEDDDRFVTALPD